MLSQIFPDSLRAGDRIRLDRGTFDFGTTKIALPSGAPDQPIRIVGEGPGETILIGNALEVPDGGQFSCGNTILENLSLVQRWKPRDDCAVLTFNATPAGATLYPFGTVPYRAKLINCHLQGPGWILYHWADDLNSPGPTVDCIDCTFRFARIAVAAANSGNQPPISGQTFNLLRCGFVGNAGADYSHYGGAVADPSFGGIVAVLARGGVVRVIDCWTDLTGAPNDPPNQVWTPRCVSVSDNLGTAYPPAGDMVLEIQNLRSVLRANGSSFVYDLDIHGVTPRVCGGMGSAVDGSLTRSPAPVPSSPR